jgi:pyruvate dehydrogenase E2 component (dihydrolipoamide acetyltransferase)
VPEILRMPEVAAGATEAVLSTWNVAVGAGFAAGDVLVTVETDKAVVDVEAESSGVVLRHLVAEGSHVEVGSPIAVYGQDGELVDDLDAFVAGLSPGVPSGAAGEQVTPSASRGPTGSGSSDVRGPSDPTPVGARVFASPLARKLARDSGLDLTAVRGSGPGGRIRRVDVESARAAAPTLQATGSPVPGDAMHAPAYVDVPHSRMRRAIAARLVESVQSAPHFYVRGSASVDALLVARQEINALGGVRVSLNDLLVKAVATSHTLVPGLNVTWHADSTRHWSQVDVAIAVATGNGLVTPVLRGVDRLTITQVASATQDLVARAKDRRLQQSELEGGSISVSNLGTYGTEEFSAIINPPHAAILAIGAARPEPVVVSGALAVATVLRVTLSVDHRPVDGVTAAEWMRTFLGLLEHPVQILA